MNWNSTLRAGALQFVVFIGALIAVLLLTFVLLMSNHALFRQKTDQSIAQLKHIDDSFYRSEASDHGRNTTQYGRLLDNNPKQTQIEKTQWGFFEKVTIRSSMVKDTLVKTGLVGSKLKSTTPALYLEDQSKPLVMVGNSHIQGDAFLPKRGLRKGNIAGISYYPESPIRGNIFSSDQKLFETFSIVSSVVRSTRNLIEDLMIQEVPLLGDNTIINSFSSPTMLLRGDHVKLTDRQITGNVLIVAESEIFVDRTSKLTDVILVAPRIHIGNEVTGRFQVIATKHIQIGNNVALRYPSTLLLHNSRSPSEMVNVARDPSIDIQPNSIIEGIVGYTGGFNAKSPQVNIYLSATSTIQGHVICEGYFDLRGKVDGSVTTRSFIVEEGGSRYINHLLDGRIYRDSLSKAYVGYPTQDDNKSIMQWLY
jgi:hypothetical protein